MNSQTEMTLSSDHFVVTLEMVGEDEKERLPALSGVRLREAIQRLLDKRGLDLDVHNISIFLASSNTPLPSDRDCFLFGGKHLRIRVKDTVESGTVTPENGTGSSSGRAPASRSNSGSSLGNKDDKLRKPSGSQRGGRKQGLMISTEELSDSTQTTPQDSTLKSSKGRSTLSRKSGIFSNTSKTGKDKMELLIDLLNDYSAQGIPLQPGLLTFNLSTEDTYKLENHWKEIVENWQDLSDKMKNQQDAIWELLQTEIFFIKRLKVITDLFLTCLCNLQCEGILNEIDTHKLFCNIQDVYTANHQFWVDQLLPMLNSSRFTKQPLNPLLMKDGFLKCNQLFQPYIKYCTEHDCCLQYVKDKNKENELFKSYVTWCETRKECDRLQLTDLLVKPVQRLTKYPLLLKAIQKKTDDKEHKQILEEMKESVESFVQNVNSSISHHHEKKRLASILSRIESYDVIDNINEEVEKTLREQNYLNLDLTQPMPGCSDQQTRQLIVESAGLKLRDSSSSKVDVHCFLFTDMFLICKAVGKKGDKIRIVRQPYLIERLKVRELKDGGGLLVLYLNEFCVVTAAFILYTQEPRNWIDNIKKAQEDYQEAKRTSQHQPRLQLLSNEYEENEDFGSSLLLGTLNVLSPQSSSQSSLVHSHSGSVDISSDPASTSSVGGLTVSPTSQNQNKATSFELGDLRNPSLASDNSNDIPRAHSFETRSGPVSVMVTSPRTNRRNFFLRGVDPSEPTPSTLSVEKHQLPRPVQVPIIPPPYSSLAPETQLRRKSPSSDGEIQPQSLIIKPPLLKTRHVSGQVSIMAPPSEVPPTECDSSKESGRRLNIKRSARDERRYHTADSVETLKKESKQDNTIHKRLSWNNYESKENFNSLGSGKLMKATGASTCLSSESICSSGVESSTSSFLSTGEQEPMTESKPDQHLIMINGDVGTSSTDPEPVTPNFELDVSEVRDGISSVQIKLTSGHNQRNKVDLRRMKELILNSYSVEASEV